MKINRVLNKEETFELLGEEWKALKHKISTLSEGESIVIEDIKDRDLVKLRGRILYYMLTNNAKYSLMSNDDIIGEWIIKRIV